MSLTPLGDPLLIVGIDMHTSPIISVNEGSERTLEIGTRHPCPLILGRRFSVVCGSSPMIALGGGQRLVAGFDVGTARYDTMGRQCLEDPSIRNPLCETSYATI